MAHALVSVRWGDLHSTFADLYAPNVVCGQRARRVLDGDADVLVASAIVATPVEVLRLNGGCSCGCNVIICCP
jgi:hypothetical protein